MNEPYRDDSDLTEITILPDGRLYVFGLSASVKDLLEALQAPAAGSPCSATTPENAQATATSHLGERHE